MNMLNTRNFIKNVLISFTFYTKRKKIIMLCLLFNVTCRGKCKLQFKIP